MVINNHTSLRGASKNLALFLNKGENAPVHSTIYNWILKAGVSNYTYRKKKKEYQAFVIDGTIEYGGKKLLLILGIPKEYSKKNMFTYSHNQIDVLGMYCLKKITKGVIEQKLKECSKKFNMPNAIIADGAGDVKGGIRLFCEGGNKSRYIYDVTHKSAIILKHFLDKDDDWQKFYASCGETRRKVLQTELYKYIPPKTRDKSRHLNLNELLKWGNDILRVSKYKKNLNSEKFQKAFAWVVEYKNKLKKWGKVIGILKVLKKRVITSGFCQHLKDDFKKDIKKKINFINNDIKIIYDQAIEYIDETCNLLDANTVVPGCSDVIESIFGKFKLFARKSPVKEITKMVMTIPIFTDESFKDKIKVLFERKTMKSVKRWLKKNIGESEFSKRCKAFKTKAIQKT